MTTTNRLGDYVVFFHETMSRIQRHYQNKTTRTQIRKRQPKMRRKSSLAEIFRKPISGQRLLLSSNQSERLSHPLPTSIPESGPRLPPREGAVGVVNIKMDRVQTHERGTKRTRRL